MTIPQCISQVFCSRGNNAPLDLLYLHLEQIYYSHQLNGIMFADFQLLSSTSAIFAV
jgi:hypothetical protein